MQPKKKKHALIIAMVLTVCSTLVVIMVVIYLVVKRMRSCELCTVHGIAPRLSPMHMTFDHPTLPFL